MILPQREGESGSTSNRFLFSSFILRGVPWECRFDTAIAHYHLNPNSIIHPLFIQAKFFDQSDILFDDAEGLLDGKGRLFRGHASLDGGEVDARQAQDVVVDRLWGVVGFPGDSVRQLAFDVRLAADDVPVRQVRPRSWRFPRRGTTSPVCSSYARISSATRLWS